MKSPNNYKILIAEDSSFNIMILQRIVTKLGYGCTIVENGEDALKEFSQNTFDLVLMDLEMPLTDGITATRKIRVEYGEKGKSVPVIAITGRLNPLRHKEILDAGMNDYLEKPFTSEVLSEKIQKHLLAHEATLTASGSMEPTPQEASPPPYDLSYLNEFTEGDGKFLQQLIQYFIASAPAVLESMKQAVADREWDELGRIVHKFGSELSFLGVNQLERDIRTLEQLAGRHEETEEIAQLTAKIYEACGLIIARLAKDFNETGDRQPVILLCEDDYMLSKTIEFKLKKDGYAVLIAANGKEAAGILSKERVDMVITDLLMPFMSGLELIEVIRKELNLSLPLMVLSRIGLEKTVIQAFDLGADDYLVKPFSPLELGIRVKKLLS